MAETTEIALELKHKPETDTGAIETRKTKEVPQVIASKEVRTSQEGHTFEFYHFTLSNGELVKIVFKGREETIDPDVLLEKHSIIIGHEPQHLTQAEWSSWQKNLDGKNSPTRLENTASPYRLADFATNDGLTMIVDQSPESLMEAALLLGAQDPRVRELYHQARTLQYSDELLEMVDTAIAGHMYSADGTENPLNSSHDAEAMLLASLLGDKEAETTLTKLKTKYDADYAQDKEDWERQDQVSLEEWKEHHATTLETLEPLSLDELVAVHVTRFYPYYDEKTGKWKVKTHFNATEGKTARTSLHWALNHVVTSHTEGQWEEAPVVIVVPLSELVRENGAPESLDPIDTYWNLNPGQDLVLPENTYILVPGKTEGRILAKGSSQDTMRHKGPDKGVRKVNYPVYELARLQDLRRRFDRKKRYATEESQEREEQLKIHREMDEEIKKVGQNRNLAVNRLITALGFKVREGTNRGWQPEGDEQYDQVGMRVKLLAEQLGTQHGWHSGSPANRTEDEVRSYFWRIETGEIKDQTTEMAELKGEIAKSYWHKLPAQQRRELWVTGVI